MLRIPVFYSIFIVLILVVASAVFLSFFYQSNVLRVFIRDVESRHLIEAKEKVIDVINFQIEQLEYMAALIKNNSNLAQYVINSENINNKIATNVYGSNKIVNLQAELNLDFFVIINSKDEIVENYSIFSIDDIINDMWVMRKTKVLNGRIVSDILLKDDFYFIAISPLYHGDQIIGSVIIGKKIKGSFMYDVGGMFKADVSIYSNYGNNRVDLTAGGNFKDYINIISHINKKNISNAKEEFLFNESDNVLSLITPVNLAGQTLFLVLSQNIKNSWDVLTGNKNILLGLMLISTIFILIVASLYTYYLFKPLRKLAIRSKALINSYNSYFNNNLYHANNKYNEIESIVKVIDYATEFLLYETISAKKEKDYAVSYAQTRTQFIATLSHEIRTPINGIIGMTEILENTAVTPEQSRCIGIIKNNGDALMSIIDDVLDLTKIENNLLVLIYSDFDIYKCIANTLRTVSPQAEKKKLELIAHIAPDIPSILRGDQDRIRQIMLNLLMNAIKFTDAGQVIVRVDRTATELPYVNLLFSVQDTGRGIPKSAQSKLFQPYTQLDSAASRKHGGVGLGLTITNHLVNLMQGECGVESDGRHGSTFWFRLRLERTPNKLEAEWEPNRALQGRRLLVVDDNPKVNAAIKAQTDYWGMTTDTAEFGHQVLDMLNQAVAQGHPYWCILIDGELIDIDVVELLSRIRNQADLAALLIVVMHTSKFKATSRAELRTSADGALSKPVEVPQLATVLVSLLNRASLAERLSEDNLTHSSGSESLSTRYPAGRILVADDNTVTQEILEFMLRKLECSADMVSDGAAAVAAALSNKYDLILMDCQMPGMSGYEAVVEILEHYGDRCPPIIAMTANALVSDREYCLQLGMSDYLAKPLTSEKIKKLLERWLPVANVVQYAEPVDASIAVLPPFDHRLDRAVWRQLFDAAASTNDDMFIEQIVNLFIDDTRARLHRIQEMAAAGQHDSLAREVHALAGGCKHIGAKKMLVLCKSMEETASQADAHELQKNAQQLGVEFSATVEALQGMVALFHARQKQSITPLH